MQKTEADARLTRIYALLRDWGAKAGFCGFLYVSYVLLQALQNPSRLDRLTEELYPETARRYHVAPDDVRRGVRRVIAAIWKKNPQRLQELSQEPLGASPSEKRFFSLACAYLQEAE